jgi:hypothetical protein
VLWRKGSFGSASEAGSRFAERLLTVVASCRQQGRPLLALVQPAAVGDSNLVAVWQGFERVLLEHCPDGSRIKGGFMDGQRQGRRVVTSEEAINYTLSYNGAADTLAGTWEWRETAPDGRVLFTSTGPVTGTRVKVEV